MQGEADPARLEELYGQVRYVNAELDSLILQKQLEFPWVSWQEYFSAAVAVPEVLQAFTLINDGLGELQAPLEQAAPFSRGEITGESISPEQAVQAARDFCRQEGLNFQLTSESKGTIPAYTVEAKDEKGRLVVEVSQKGGMAVDDALGRRSREQANAGGDVGAAVPGSGDFPPCTLLMCSYCRTGLPSLLSPCGKAFCVTGSPSRYR